MFDEGTPLAVGTVPFDDIFEWLAELTFSVYVVEDYIIRAGPAAGGYQHQWNKGEALQIIGAFKLHATKTGALVVLQQPSIKPMAARITGLPYDKNKSGTHVQDACLHGAYYWRKEHGLAPDANETSSGATPQQGVQHPARVRQIDSWSGLREKRDR